jgi:exopolysaccharide biosynthesis polyprenyl glycosylphosphotransferase
MATQGVDSQLSITAITEISARLESAASPRPEPPWSEWFGRSRARTALSLMSDLFAVLLAQWIAKTAAERWLHVPNQHLEPASYYFFFVPFFAVTLYLFNAYRGQDLQRPERELELVCKAATFSFLLLIAANFVIFRGGFSRYFVLTWYLISLPLLLMARFGLRAFYGTLWSRGFAQKRALLIGAPRDWAGFQDVLSLQRHRGYKVIGALVPEDCGHCDASLEGQIPVLGGVTEWEEVFCACPIDLVVICSETLAQQLAPRMLPHCTNRRVAVEAYSRLFGGGALRYELDEFSGFLRFRADPRYSRCFHLFLKALLDRIVGVVGSLVTLLLVAPIGGLIKWEDRGPIFYRSAYLTQDGNVKYYLKFRTMCVNADQVLATSEELRQRFETKYKLETDPRVTRVGKFLRKYSLDEFPQFFSVLLGKLSFVGPRTIRREEASRYGDLLPKLLTFKPGVTGFWQVMGRQTTTYEERVLMDMFYIDHWSIWLDLVIMAKTIWQIVSTEGAY